MIKPSLVRVLVEDELQQRLVRLYLYRLGFSMHQIRFVKLPSGQGSGEQLVREEYPNQVKLCRDRSSKAATALIVAIDADTEGMTRRSEQFRSSLKENQVAPTTGTDRIVHLIPNRNIETWILCLTGQAVDEQTNYKKWSDFNPLVKPAAEALFAWSRLNGSPASNCIPSLHAALPELRRLEIPTI